MMTTKSLEKILWPVFLIWSTVGLLSVFLQVDAAMIERTVSETHLQSFFSACLSWGDFIFHLLAAVTLLFSVAAYLGWKKTWKAFVIIVVVSALVEAIGAKTGVLFGPYFYTPRMGPLLADTLPLAIPLAWWNILSSFYLLTRHFLPRLGPRGTSLIVALMATILDWVMEPFAWKIKGYWIWQTETIPFQNYAGWFVLSFILSRVAPLYLSYRPGLDKRVLAVPLVMLTFFLSARLIHGI